MMCKPRFLKTSQELPLIVGPGLRLISPERSKIMSKYLFLLRYVSLFSDRCPSKYFKCSVEISLQADIVS